MGQKIILGDGLNGLIFGFYNPDFDVRALEGEYQRPPMDDMVVLHDTPETRKLLADLKLPVVPKEKSIRYFFNGREYPFIPEPVLTEYVLKKVGWRQDMVDKDRTLTQPGATFRYLDIRISEVEERLRMEVPIIPIAFGDIPTNYECILSTLPAPVFWGRWPGKRPPRLQLLSTGASYKLAETPPNGIERDFAWAYFADDRPFHRVGHCHDRYVYEFAGVAEGADAVLRSAIIRSDPHNHPPPGVLFCGRFATWRHWWKFQHTIRMATRRFEWEQLWSRQAWFETFHMDLNREVDELTEDTIYYIVSLESELHELLRELQWKRWKQGQRLQRERVLEEFVDAFKFLVTLGCLWNFSPDEVYDMFLAKSTKVEKEFFDVQS